MASEHINESSGKCKLKPKWDTTVHPSKCLTFKSLTILNIGDVQCREFLFSADENIN